MPYLCLSPESNAARKASRSSVPFCFARRSSQSLRILRCDGVMCLSTFLSVSERIDTMRPKAVSGEMPTKSAANSDHFIPLRSRDNRMQYCDWKLLTIRSQSSHMSYHGSPLCVFVTCSHYRVHCCLYNSHQIAY